MGMKNNGFEQPIFSDEADDRENENSLAMQPLLNNLMNNQSIDTQDLPAQSHEFGTIEMRTLRKEL